MLHQPKKLHSDWWDGKTILNCDRVRVKKQWFWYISMYHTGIFLQKLRKTKETRMASTLAKFKLLSPKHKSTALLLYYSAQQLATHRMQKCTLMGCSKWHMQQVTATPARPTITTNMNVTYTNLNNSDFKTTTGSITCNGFLPNTITFILQITHGTHNFKICQLKNSFYYPHPAEFLPHSLWCFFNPYPTNVDNMVSSYQC